MKNHVCDILDILEQHYKFDIWDSYYKKEFEVYEVCLVCPICGEKSIWLEYRFYKDNLEYEIYDSILTYDKEGLKK